MSTELSATLAPLQAVLELLNEVSNAPLADHQPRAVDVGIATLMTAPGVGAITATAFVAAVDDVQRFRNASRVASYIGLVPRDAVRVNGVDAGASSQRAAPAPANVSASRWCLWRCKRPEAGALRAWADAVAQRRGKRVAVIGLARRLARILFAMWRDEQEFDAARIRTAADRSGRRWPAA